jgi:DNA-binding HxlR family transcriptional regulator
MNRTYGQYCGVVRALEMVGERWALLIIRDLLVEPKRYTDLRKGLPKIPTNILAARLKEMEEFGVIQRRVLPRPSSAVVYELTDYGRELEGVVIGLGKWGAQSLGEMREGEIFTTDSMIMALRTTFQPDAAQGEHLRYEFHFGPVLIHAIIDDGTIQVDEGALENPDAVFDVQGPVNQLMDGHVTPEEAMAAGWIHITGGDGHLEHFASMFRIGPKAELESAGVATSTK